MNKLKVTQQNELMTVLQARFEKNMVRHKNQKWETVENHLSSSPLKLKSIYNMESSGGEPDVVDLSKNLKEIYYVDCSLESPSGRRSYCYDEEALNSRKENKPKSSALSVAKELGIEILNEEQYHTLQQFGPFDLKTSSWLLTPSDIRSKGGSIFGDYRFGRVFIYHNGAESYYAARGFRGAIRIDSN